MVIAATPPVISAMGRASMLPPPWPPIKGTVTEPSSATATIGGSSRFAVSNGATERIRIPLAHIPITGRPASNSAAMCVGRGRMSRPNLRGISAVREGGRRRAPRAIAVRSKCCRSRARRRSQCRRVVVGSLSNTFGNPCNVYYRVSQADRGGWNLSIVIDNYLLKLRQAPPGGHSHAMLFSTSLASLWLLDRHQRSRGTLRNPRRQLPAAEASVPQPVAWLPPMRVGRR